MVGEQEAHAFHQISLLLRAHVGRCALRRSNYVLLHREVLTHQTLRLVVDQALAQELK